ncbi:MAG: hypothetical protein GY793_00600 [Proteobacteria bacterium]|nr:hypothetical protein [Pseudomonadota bacterium]
MAYAQILLEKEEKGKVKQKLSGIGLYFPLMLSIYINSISYITEIFIVCIFSLFLLLGFDPNSSMKVTIFASILSMSVAPLIYIIIKKDFLTSAFKAFNYIIYIYIFAFLSTMASSFFLILILGAESELLEPFARAMAITLNILFTLYFANNFNKKHLKRCIKKGYKIKTIKIMKKSIFYMYKKYVKKMNHEEIVAIIKTKIANQTKITSK